jgi:hypothetical protein
MTEMGWETDWRVSGGYVEKADFHRVNELRRQRAASRSSADACGRPEADMAGVDAKSEIVPRADFHTFDLLGARVGKKQPVPDYRYSSEGCNPTLPERARYYVTFRHHEIGAMIPSVTG